MKYVTKVDGFNILDVRRPSWTFRTYWYRREGERKPYTYTKEEMLYWTGVYNKRYETLRSYDPTKEKQMNEIIDKVQDQANSIEVKHFALALDKDGKEIRVEINPNTGIAQDADEEEKPTVH